MNWDELKEKRYAHEVADAQDLANKLEAFKREFNRG
jgi:hypothetical protein